MLGKINLKGKFYFLNFLIDEELNKIKVVLDFLFFDINDKIVSFKRFEECILPLTKSKNLPLADIFLEICGPNRKYITFARFIKAYLAFKRSDPKYSIEFKNFFSLLFTEVVKVIYFNDF